MENPEHLRQTLSDNVARLMSARDVRQEQLAQKSGVSQSTISRIRRLESAATIDSLAAIAGVLEVEPWQLLVPGFDLEAMKFAAWFRSLSTQQRQKMMILSSTVSDDAHDMFMVDSSGAISMLQTKSSKQQHRDPDHKPLKKAS